MATRSNTDQASAIAVSTIWASLFAMQVINVWDIKATEPLALSGLIIIISAFYVAQQFESSARGLGAGTQVLSQFLLVPLTAMVACAGTASLAVAAVAPLYAIGCSLLGAQLRDFVWSPHTAMIILAGEAAYQAVFKASALQIVARIAVSVAVTVASSVAGWLRWWSDECVTHTHTFIQHAPLELQCHWLAMLQPFVLLQWRKRLWYCFDEHRRRVLLVKAATCILCTLLALGIITASGCLWSVVEVPSRFGYVHRQQLATLVFTILACRWQQGSPNSLSNNQESEVKNINAISRDDFHATTIRVYLPDVDRWIEVLADLGAATSVMKVSTLGKAATQTWKLTKQFQS